LKIRTKLILWFLLVVLIASLGISYFEYRITKDIFTRNILNELATLAEAKEGQVFAYLDSIEARTIDFASDGFIREKLKEIINNNSAQAIETLNEHLINNKKPLDKTLTGIFVADLNGKIVASTNNKEIGKNESLDEYFLEGKKGVFITELRRHEHFGLKHMFIVTAPLTDKDTGELLGVLGNIFDTKKINDILLGIFQLKKGAISRRKGLKAFEIYLVNKEKIMFVHPNTEMIHKHTPGMVADTLPIQKCLNDKEEINGEYTNYNGVKVFGASICIPDRGWTLVVEVRKKEILNEIKKIRNYFLITGIMALLMTIIISLIIARNITNPIKKLSEGAGIIGKGNLDYKTNIKSNDEIGQLSEAFDKMTAELKESRVNLEKYHVELEGKVKERTAELNQKVEALEKFHKLVVGRELKMIELKKKIKELEEKIKKNEEVSHSKNEKNNR
jgi:HAMP domain-containing protein